MGNAIKFLGNTDEVTTCDCCGRANLKSTVALSIDDGEPVFYGVTCAAKALKVPAKEVRAGAARADRAKADAEAAARRIAWAAEHAPWFAFLAAHGKGDDNGRRIESLGGYVAARATFEQSKGV